MPAIRGCTANSLLVIAVHANIGGVVTDDDLAKNAHEIMDFHQYLHDRIAEAQK